MRFEVKEKVKIRIQEVLNLEVEKVRRQKEVTIPKINFQELSSVKDLMLEGQGTGTGYSDDSHSLMIDDDASSARSGSVNGSGSQCGSSRRLTLMISNQKA